MSDPLDPMGCNPLGSSVHGVSQTRILEWVSIFFFKGSSWPRNQTCVSCSVRQILYHWATREAHIFWIRFCKFKSGRIIFSALSPLVYCFFEKERLQNSDLMDRRPQDSCPWNSPGKNTGVSSHSLLQGIFPTQGSNLGPLHCRVNYYHLSHQEKSFISLGEWKYDMQNLKKYQI